MMTALWLMILLGGQAPAALLVTEGQCRAAMIVVSAVICISPAGETAKNY